MASRREDEPRGERPEGREAVMAGLLDAAERLFAQRGPQQVTVREIAAAAGVNHGLVHRHFSSKEQLLHALMVRESGRLTAAVADAASVAEVVDTLYDLVADSPGFLAIVAQVLLSTEDLSTIMVDDGALQHAAALLEQQRSGSTGPDGAEPAVVVALAAALAVGWLFFRPFLARAAGIETVPLEEMDLTAKNLMRQLLLMMPSTSDA